jgi:hypothetical protein
MNKHSELSTRDVIGLLSNRFPEVRLPDEFISFLNSQKANRHQLRRVDGGNMLVDFFTDQGVDQYYFSSFLSPDSRLLPEIDYPALLRLSPEEAYTFFLDQFSYVFDLQDVALDSELQTGFNRHGREHLRNTAKNAIELLRELNIGRANHNRAENEAVIGALLHDIGNIISRRYHGFYGIYILTRLFKNFSVDERTLKSRIWVSVTHIDVTAPFDSERNNCRQDRCEFQTRQF